MSQFDKRIKINTIVENHLPEFVTSDFPNAVEFLKQYYISQEFQGGPTDLISNLDQYLKSDNLVPEVVTGKTSTVTGIASTDKTIEVENSKGYPDEYGLLKINDEIITYTGKEKTVELKSSSVNANFTSKSSKVLNLPTKGLDIKVNDIVELITPPPHLSDNEFINVPKGTRVAKIEDDKITVDNVITTTLNPTENNPTTGKFAFFRERFFFTGCIRGFSGITGYNVGVSSSLLDVNKEKVNFEETRADNHISGSTVQNLSVLFIQEFYKKLKKTFLPGFEDTKFTSDLDVGNFVKFARSFYQSKGIEESIKILFKVLYGVDSTILDLERNLIKPSGAEFIRREVIIADLITPDADPQKLIGQTIYKSDDLKTNASVSEVEILNERGKSYYRISLFVGYSDRDLIKGVFEVNPYTKVISGVSTSDSVISVDSTVGFAKTGIIISGNNTINYTSKSVNQFFGCTGISHPIEITDDVRSNDFIFGYEDGDLSKKIELRVTGVLDQLIVDDRVNLIDEGENIGVKNLGVKIRNEGKNYKEIFANSWIYNTSSRFQTESIKDSIVTLNTLIDKSSIRVGDKFNILRRSEQTVIDSLIVKNILNSKQFEFAENPNFTPVDTEKYDIRRVVDKATSSEVEIREGNESIISNVLNVYVDGDTDGYVASNSLPKFDIDDDVIKETIVGMANTTDNFPFDPSSQDPITGLYSILQFHFDPIRDIKFIEGDAVVYNSIKDPSTTTTPSLGELITGLNDGQIYYVDPQPAPSNTNITKIALYASRGQIGSASTVKVGLGISTKDEHTFTLLRHHNKKISANKIFRKFPLSQNLIDKSTNDKTIGDIGLLTNGVEIRSPLSEDSVIYGNLTSINLINAGENYDIVNPPKLLIEPGIAHTVGSASSAFAEPILSGSVREVLIDPQDFDIKSVKSISLTGLNGEGCELEANVGARYREVFFNSRKIEFGGGVDIVNETITFNDPHKLEDGQLVYYQNNGNSSLGIGSAYSPIFEITGSLGNSDPYFVRVVNPTTIRIFNKKNDALAGIAGINTVGLATDSSATGNHSFRTESKNTITSINVLNSGSGYQHRKLHVKPSGISTSYDTINFNNHGFKNGDLVNYSPTVGIGSTIPKAIQGLDTTLSYHVMKIDDNSFRLANAGVGGTSRVDFERGKFVGLNSTGTGYQTFNYPDIKVNIEVVYNGNVTGSFNVTPIITGSFTGAYLYEEGSDYGSTIVNNLSNPKVDILNGRLGGVKPIIENGKVVDVAVLDQGMEYNSIPDIIINSSGTGEGAIVRPIISEGRLVDAIVISSGIGYDQATTTADVVTRGINANFDSSIRILKLNKHFREKSTSLITRDDYLSYNVLSCNESLLSNLENGDFELINEKPQKHSPIIGWAYDGNPIYGPTGYSDPDDINSELKLLESSYSKDINLVENRPVGFADGMFIDDFIFDNSGDLDIHNGRFCKTPDFPNGIYAYFATIELDNNGEIDGVYPYFIGRTFRSSLTENNLNLNQDFDFNNSNLKRNTYPYNVGERFADNDFLIESYENSLQSAEVLSVLKGEIDNIEILNPGQNYKVGDLTSFNETGTNGQGFSAEVGEIVGLGVSSIETTLDRFEDLVFTRQNQNTVIGNYKPFIELNDQDFVFVSGLSTSIQNLTDSFKVGVTTSRVALAKSMSIVGLSSVVEDIFVNQLPENISVGSSIRVGSGNALNDEIIEVLNVYEDLKIIRSLRRINGAGHTFGSNVDLLNNIISIPVKTEKFDSQLNDVVYFNSVQSIGVGTDGVGISTDYLVGETIESVSIPNRQIYLPNHPFETGQKVILTVPPVPNRQINVSMTGDPNDTDGNFAIPYGSLDTEIELFVIKKSENYIGLSTVSVGNTSDGLYFNSNASAVVGLSTFLYNISSKFNQVTGAVDKIVSTVTTKVAAAETTTHNLQNGDIVKINVVPNLTVGIGTTVPIEVNYNSEFEKLLINPIKFTNADVESNRIDIEDHGFNTGDKVFYEGSAGLGTGSYFINKINSRYFQLAETYKDLFANPIRLIEIIPNTGGSEQTISPINPQIKVYKNSKIKFGLSTTTLAEFDFKIFYQNGSNEFLSSQDSSIFNVGVAGTIGLGTDIFNPEGATLTLQPTNSTPSVLYYGITKGGFISTADNDVQNYSQIIFLDSVYNGEYKISEVTSETFNFSPKLPEFLTYNEEDCEKIEYSTSSKNVKGGIKKLNIISKGYNYKKLPEFNTVLSEEGTNANLVIRSNDIGRVKKTRILDIGYEYSSDKTLQPEVFIPSILNIDNLDTISEIEIVNGGSDYTTPPDLILFNPSTNQIIDDSSILAISPNQTISDINLIAPIHGLDSTSHQIFAINNSNGIGINSIRINQQGLIECFMQVPFSGFNPEPFAVGDEIFIEGIQRVDESGDGFNSSDYNFKFFKVEEYTGGTEVIVKYSVAGLSTNPGIAVTFQSGFASIINKQKYPNIVPVQKRGVFQLNEKLLLNDEKVDVSVIETRDDYIKLDGLQLISIGDRITGRTTGVSAEVVALKSDKGFFSIDFSNRREYGWINNIGKLNEDVQVIPDNDYYQNLSYSVKSPITWDQFSNSVNSIVHPSGLKNFADTFIQSRVDVRSSKTNEVIRNFILDLVSDDNRVDAINNFDYVRDYERLKNKTKSILFSTRRLTNFNKCITNRVIMHDDISGRFSSVGFSANNSVIDTVNGRFVNYLIQIVDPDTFDTQLSEIIVLTTEDDVILLEKTSDTAGVGEDNTDGNLKLGEFKTETTDTDTVNLLFEPVEKFTRDHDIKILKTFYDIDILGTTTNVIGSINLISANVDANSNSTTSIFEFDKDEFNGLQANIFVQDTVTKEYNYNEILLDFDGVNTSLSQIYSDDVIGISTNKVGIITSKLENGLVKLQIENDRNNNINTKSSIVGLGTTTAGIGTHRFLAQGQPSETERSIRFESTFNEGTATPISFASIDKTIDSSIKSLVKVSAGQTSAIHQVTAIRDDSDILVVQYPYVSLGSTSGIGSFTSSIVGDDISISFVPDSDITDEVKVQAYNQVFYTDQDFSNNPLNLSYGNVTQSVLLSAYDGLEGKRADKTEFELKHEGTPIYTKTFNPDGVGLEKSTGTFTIPNHFFNTNEELEYTPGSSFVGVAATPVSIGSTVNNVGLTTDILPSTVFVKVLSDINKFQLFPTRDDITSGVAITFTGVGSGNRHKLNMTKKLSKTMIGLDGIVQQPVTFTSLTHTLDVSIGTGTSQFSLSGIGSIATSDILKINDEFMKIIEVGFSSTSDGSGKIDDQQNISEGLSTVPTVRVERGVLGIGATSHDVGDLVRVHRGSFNIVDSSVHFVSPPKGNTRSRKTDTELPFVKADFSGRTFTRQDYETNMLFDDISDNFTGLTTNYTLKVGGANTSAGVQIGNGVVFINGVYQRPFTASSSKNNYKIVADTIAGISSIRFTGITSTDGSFIVSPDDINQNQIPRGGLIVSLGSTPGLGYAPLVGAKVIAEKNASGELTGIVGIGTSSGFNLGIQTAVYDNTSGIITVTTNDVHGFALDRPTTVKLKNLEFKCPKDIVGQDEDGNQINSVTDAVYDTSNGNLVITLNDHGLVNGDAVVLETDSFTFTCTLDPSQPKTYPRATDPAANQYLTVDNVTTNTFRVNVGASAPGDQYPHNFVSATDTAVQTIGGGGYVGVTTTIFQDHERPLFVVGIVSERSFEVQAGASTIPHTYQGGGHAFEFFEDLTFGSGYRGGTVAIGVTDIAYEHKFVSSGIGSIRKTAYNGDAFTATDAIYESHSGLLTLVIPNHTFITGQTVGIDTGGIVFKCSKDGFLGNHPYPRAVSKTSFPNSDPFAGSFVSVGATSIDSITFNVGPGGGGGTGAVVEATVGVGGTLAFTITNPGSGYVNPQINIPEPIYENLEVVGISRLGVGPTEETGANLLLNVDVGTATTSVGIGSTLFTISKFEIARAGYSFKKGDKFKPVGLVTAAHLSAPIQEFELEVLEIFNDKFSAWQFGEIDSIDNIKFLQDGQRTRFPLFFNGELLSFEKDRSNDLSALIDLDAVLLVFVNGVLQKPGESYQFNGGTTFTFKEPPQGETGEGLNDHDQVDIYFYKGEDNKDVKIQVVPETVKIGDELRIFKSDRSSGITTSQTSSRVVKEILNTDILDTDIYTGLGIDDLNEKPVKWMKQKRDLTINGTLVSKSRSILEPQIYPTSKIIGDFTTTSGLGVQGDNSIFVDDAQSFFFETRYGLTVSGVDALVSSGEVNTPASAIANVSGTGTISSLTIIESGSGYDGTVDVRIAAPPSGIGAGVGNTATATLTVSNGSVAFDQITDGGLGYDSNNPPKVIIESPPFKYEKITGIANFEGYTGIITGITQITRPGSKPALRFDFTAVVRETDTDSPNFGRFKNAPDASILEVGFPILITDTKVGHGLTSVNPTDAHVVGIGTTFLDNVYIVNSVDYSIGGAKGTVICHVHSNSASSINGIDEEGFFEENKASTTSLGKLSWGRLYGSDSGNDLQRSSNPISIGVTGLTVDAGLSTFPTIQRKNYDGVGETGHRNSGSIRAELTAE